jgi:hypothetical protein
MLSRGIVWEQHEQRFSVLRYGPLKVEKMDPGAWDAHPISHRLLLFCTLIALSSTPFPSFHVNEYTKSVAQNTRIR